MKSLKIIALLVLMLVVFVDCNNGKYDKEKPKDFAFKFIGEIDSYDSKSGVYTRKYLYKDTLIKINLTEEELSLIYNSFKKCDFMSFPNEFKCSGEGTFILPAFSNTIEITYKGTNKKVTNTDYCSKKIEQSKSNKFDKFSNTIWEIIAGKPQVKSMRRTDIVFM